MNSAESLSILELASVQWPETITLPRKRFRLLVAADVKAVDADNLARFARSALEKGMVYFCAWGPDCERFHDVVDEIVIADESGDKRFIGPSKRDVIMTTWHANEPLEEALWFFKYCAVPTEGFLNDSEHWVAFSVGNPEMDGGSKTLVHD